MKNFLLVSNDSEDDGVRFLESFVFRTTSWCKYSVLFYFFFKLFFSQILFFWKRTVMNR